MFEDLIEEIKNMPIDKLTKILKDEGIEFIEVKGDDKNDRTTN